MAVTRANRIEPHGENGNSLYKKLCELGINTTKAATAVRIAKQSAHRLLNELSISVLVQMGRPTKVRDQEVSACSS